MTQDVITVFENPDNLYESAADLILDVIHGKPGDDPVHIALCGGSTPRPVYERLAQVDDVDWNRVHIYWGDERTVPPDDAESNFHMTSETLLSHVPINKEAIHRMRGEIDPQEAADEYEAILREKFGLDDGEFPRFDLVLLGMGSDGHTASLFPGTPALEETSRLVVANPVPQLNTMRITLTYPVLNAAHNVCFLVSGEDKAEALQSVFSPNGKRPPAARVQPTDGNLRWLVDRAAARLLN